MKQKFLFVFTGGLLFLGCQKTHSNIDFVPQDAYYLSCNITKPNANAETFQVTGTAAQFENNGVVAFYFNGVKDEEFVDSIYSLVIMGIKIANADTTIVQVQSFGFIPATTSTYQFTDINNLTIKDVKKTFNYIGSSMVFFSHSPVSSYSIVVNSAEDKPVGNLKITKLNVEKKLIEGSFSCQNLIQEDFYKSYQLYNYNILSGNFTSPLVVVTQSNFNQYKYMLAF